MAYKKFRGLPGCAFAFVMLCAPALFAQTTFLTADGQTDSYTLIQNVLGAGPETPDCSHPSFGHHITQAMDNDLNKSVFVFHIHVTPDNDRCTNFDRQRLEIKTDGSSPAETKAFLNDHMVFRWKFKLPAGFQSSPNFTHIHQIKAGDGDAGAPIITLTPRRGSPDVIQIIHNGGSSGGSLGTVKSTPIAPFLGVWVEAYEKVTFSHTGSYSIVIKRVSDGATLLTYSNSNLNMWRTGTTFCRPKWGIYRSLITASDLRDEDVRFDRFCIAKAPSDCPGEQPAPDFTPGVSPGTQTINAGSSASYTASVTPLNGFTDTVDLAVSGLPAGASASFAPASIIGGSGSSALKISTSGSTPAGTYTLTIHETSGSLSHSVSTVLTVTATTTCVTAGSAFQNTAFASQTGSFTATFDATPSVPKINSVIGLSKGAQTGYTGFAALVRFNPTGDIDARSGGGYAAVSMIPYSGGKTYHFRLTVNVAARTYSIFVTPPDAGELTVGTDFKFRTEQSSVTSLDHWGVEAATGSDTVCSFTLQ